MKKFLTLLLSTCLLFLATANFIYAQDGVDAATTDVDTVETEMPPPQTDLTTGSINDLDDDEEEVTGVAVLKKYFLDGGWVFMGIVLICLIIGLAICIERILSLNLQTVNTDRLLGKVENALQDGNVNEALEITRSTRGPVAELLYQGLSRTGEGIDVVEKSIVSYGSVLMGRLERGLVWIALFIALAPMLGFMGTVIGMVEAFDAIEKAGDISPSLVAGGIKVALLTTLFGLIVAIILQIFYNYLVSKIDGMVNRMEDASISFVDLLIKYNVAKRV